MTIRSIALALVLLGIAGASSAAQGSALRTRVDAYRVAHDVEIVRELSDFLAIPNLASDSVNIRRNAQHLIGMLRRRGIEGRLLESPSGGAPAGPCGGAPSPGGALAGRRDRRGTVGGRRAAPPCVAHRCRWAASAG